MTRRLEHILLTRFNLPSPGAEQLIREQDGWLRERVQLFEQFCLPSVRAQTERRFHWIVYIDPRSPEWFMQWVEGATADGTFHAVPRAQVPRDLLMQDIRRVAGCEPETLITTNLDNDDGLAVDFVARVQAQTTVSGRTAVYMTRGLIWAGGGLYLRTDRHNAFVSVREPWESAVTCWSEWHNRLHLQMPTVEADGAPAWLQVVHGSNVSNRVRGRRVPPAPYARLFGQLLDDVEAPSVGDIVVDTLLHVPRRAVREAVRAVAKRLVTTLLGREGVDRLRRSRASARTRA
ncbi:glycosyltransferase [uncultured Cellulomonas sp.]|uniref:glycosyltransferase n=1 Tax=uncultured Cellulomonas sp. TaxID=189682 RepID=UPI00261529AB|nr:glycosyltransferase [uncultured Cellulomonas sp.]